MIELIMLNFLMRSKMKACSRLVSINTFIFLLTLSPAIGAETFTGTVDWVTDGNSISVTREGKSVRVRIFGIDCPDMDQKYGKEAKALVRELAFGKLVSVDPKGKDRYGQTVGQVKLPSGKSLSPELIKAGACWWYKRYATEEVELKALEEKARREKLGLWADPKPEPPWKWQRRKRRRSEY